MKKIKICYSSINNMGDMLNRDLIEYCFNCKVMRSDSYDASISGIGSGLGTFQYTNSKIKNFKRLFWGFVHPKVDIWGTGFISYSTPCTKFYKRKINFCAVRGNLTKQKVEEIIGKKLDIPVGDGGILSSYMLDYIPEKKYEVGIIPHYREKDSDIFKKISKQFNNAVIIDVQDSPINVIKKIAECKYIISSSLHGLIIADSLRVPNIHVVVTDKLLGDGFKFDDYYSAYNIEHKYINLNKESISNVDIIKNNYNITDEMVDKMKKDMLNAFPIAVKEKLLNDKE